MISRVTPILSNDTVVIVVVKVTSKVPLISALVPTFKSPPILRFSAIPVPPSTINAPVAVFVEVVVSLMLTTPVKSPLPLTEEFPAIFKFPLPVIFPLKFPPTVVIPVDLNVAAVTPPVAIFNASSESVNNPVFSSVSTFGSGAVAEVPLIKVSNSLANTCASEMFKSIVLESKA